MDGAVASCALCEAVHRRVQSFKAGVVFGHADRAGAVPYGALPAVGSVLLCQGKHQPAPRCTLLPLGRLAPLLELVVSYIRLCICLTAS